MKRSFKGVEPWMFESFVEVEQPDGSVRRVYGEIGRFTLIGRLRMFGRRLIGRTACETLPLAEQDAP